MVVTLWTSHTEHVDGRSCRLFAASSSAVEHLLDRRSGDLSVEQVQQVGIQGLTSSSGPRLERPARLVGHVPDLHQ